MKMTIEGEFRLDMLAEELWKSGKGEVDIINIIDRIKQGATEIFTTRVKCPACGMNGAKFMQCVTCGGPMCDNCLHLLKSPPRQCCTCREGKPRFQ